MGSAFWNMPFQFARRVFGGLDYGQGVQSQDGATRGDSMLSGIARPPVEDRQQSQQSTQPTSERQQEAHRWRAVPAIAAAWAKEQSGGTVEDFQAMRESGSATGRSEWYSING